MGESAAAGSLPGSSQPERGLRDRAWAAFMRNADIALRRLNGVYEFTDDPDCVLRVSLEQASGPLLLADGTRIEPGAPIGELHFWNEHIPPFPPHGPDLRWAKMAERRFCRSMAALARHACDSPEWSEVVAIKAVPALAGAPSAAQMGRLAKRHGFEMQPAMPPRLTSLHEWCDNMMVWAFERAFNPGALEHHGLLRGRAALWISRAGLMQRFLPPPEQEAERLAACR